MKQQEFSGETVQLATRIPKGLHLRVRVRALDVGRTLADWVSEALREHLARCRKNDKRAKTAPADAT